MRLSKFSVTLWMRLYSICCFEICNRNNMNCLNWTRFNFSLAVALQIFCCALFSSTAFIFYQIDVSFFRLIFHTVDAFFYSLSNLFFFFFRFFLSVFRIFFLLLSRLLVVVSLFCSIQVKITLILRWTKPKNKCRSRNRFQRVCIEKHGRFTLFR